MDRHWLGGEALEGNREAVRTSTLNQHVQELIHLLTSCHLLQQTTKRRVEGIRRRVPPATNKIGGSRPHKWLSLMQERDATPTQGWQRLAGEHCRALGQAQQIRGA